MNWMQCARGLVCEGGEVECASGVVCEGRSVRGVECARGGGVEVWMGGVCEHGKRVQQS